MAAPTSFAAATAVTARTSHTYTGDFRDDWCIGSVPHGGYVTATLLRVAALHFGTTLATQRQPHALAAHVEFLRRTGVGPCLFTVTDAKLGRQTSTVHVTLSQRAGGDGGAGAQRVEVVAYITHTDLAAAAGPSLRTAWALHPPPPPASPGLFHGGGGDELWAPVAELPFPAFRKATHKMRFFWPRAGQRVAGAVDHWVCLATPDPGVAQHAERKERFTNEALGFVADMWLQVIDVHRDQASAGSGAVLPKRMWYPTLLLNLEVKKALPPAGVEWLFVRVQAKEIKDGRFDLEAVIFDEDGELVALSHHVCFALDASRNLAERSKGEQAPKL